MSEQPAPGLLTMIGPGVLVAATGVGAGDLATAAFTGGKLGTAVLWAVIVGAALKYSLTEGLARYQLATDETLLEGAVRRLGRPVAWGFLIYLLVWTVFVGAALVSACGVAAQALLPLGDALTGKRVWGGLHSLAGVALVLAGGFKLFERIMAVCIGVMFVTVVVTAVALWPELEPPNLATVSGEGLEWTVALMGGVGGTVTVLAYGYWIREEGREGLSQLQPCRIDLGVGYAVTAIFGLGMVVIGSQTPIPGGGARLIVEIGARLQESLGAWARWTFLIGAWGAIFSSLLGVWQSVPYLFADFVGLTKGEAKPVDTAGWPYRGYLLFLASVPCLGLFLDFKQVQKLYAVVGACFLPLLGLALLALNREAIVGKRAANGPLSIAVIGLTAVFFLYVLGLKVRDLAAWLT